MKLLFNFSDKNHTTLYAFAPAGRNNILLLLPTYAMSVGFIHILICITKICKNMT